MFKILDQVTPDAGTALGKTTTIALFGGSGTSIMFGLSSTQWQVLGVIGGLILGVAGFAANVAFKYLHYKLAEKRAGLGTEVEA